MSGYYIAAKDAPDSVRRYVKTFNGIGSVSFGNKASVSVKVGQKYTGNRQFEVAQSIVDIMREAAATAKAPAWWGSVEVQDYESTCHYPRPEDAPKAAVVDNPPQIAQAFDGSWRQVPIDRFQKTFRGWKFAYAFVDAQGIPRADSVERNTKTELVQILFDSIFPVFRELVLTFPEVGAPAPEAPPVEKTNTAAELAAIEPMSEAVYNRLPGDKAHYLYETDIAFRTAVDKMWALQTKVKEAFDRKQAEEDRKKALDALKKKMEGDHQ